MTQLSANMYRQGSTLFGLKDAQALSDRERVVRNAIWYNEKGERLSSGDLSTENLRRIAAEIDEDSVFFILTFHDATFSKATPRIDSPDLENVKKRAFLVITRGHVYRIDRNGSLDSQTQSRAYGLPVEILQA
jgi:hypothetical protein